VVRILRAWVCLVGPGAGSVTARSSSLKNILVPVEDHDKMQVVLATACQAGRLFSGRIEGIALGPDTGDLIAADFAIAGSIFDEKTRRVLVEQARRIFDTAMTAENVAPSQNDVDRCSYAWSGSEMSTDSGIGAYARLFDLIVVGRPGAGRGDPRRATLESVLFDSGRPILIAPPKPTQTLGKTIVISWNRSTETARSVAFAMPFLKRAERITVLGVSGAVVPGPSAALLARALQRHGLPVDTVEIDSGSKNAGKVILEQAAALGGDLLIKGGYTQSRLRQMIFGGPTNEILANAELPVFMAH
jgi:nucleotide-binding universal stress UspA family protein